MPFETTRWSIVRNAGLDADDSRAAMEELCQTYWMPLFIYLRRKGHSQDNAEEVLQAFFLVFLEKGYASNADKELGRFRTYLIMALNRFLSKLAEKHGAKKRGGGIDFVRMDIEMGESLHERLGSLDLSPEALFERQWAFNILNQALEKLSQYYSRIGKKTLYDKIYPILASPGTSIDYDEVSEQLDTNPSALRVAVHRLKSRYRDCIVEVISDTVASPEDVATELDYLMAAVSKS